MGLIPDDVIDEIRQRADIVAIIGQHVQLRKAGRNHKGLCPFHNERSPSFNVNDERQFFYCFGCHKKGDVFTFVMEYEGRSFVEAAETLAARFGVTIPERRESPAAARQRSERTAMLDLNKRAMQFYRRVLDSRAGAAGRAYLDGRGIDAETAQAFQLGFAPDAWSALADHLQRERVDMDLAVKVGLVARRPRSGGFYDKFRSRLMCPVVVPGGECAGFSGRIIGGDKETAKYINSPESAVYKKSKLLFGLQRARDGFRAKGRAVLVEGNFDVIALHQHGFTETVAPLGTAITDDQVRLLKRLTDEVILLYDGDNAGRAATLKALRLFVAADIKVRIATLPAGEDPDTMVSSGRATKLKELIDKAQLAIQYFAIEIWSKDAQSTEGKARALAEAGELLANVANPTKRDLITGTLASAMGVEDALVRRGLARGAQRARRERDNASGNTEEDEKIRRKQLPVPPSDELQLLAILADHPDLMGSAEEHGVFSLLTDERLRDMYSAARGGASMLSALPDETSPAVAAHILKGTYASVTDPAHCLAEAVATIRAKRAKERLDGLQRRAVEAKRRGDAALERELFREILELRKQVD